MSDVEINGIQFRTGRLDVFEQAKVLKRTARLLQGIMIALSAGGDLQAGDDPQAGDGRQAMEGLGHLTEALSEMPDADLDYVLKTCLNKATMRNSENGNWARVMVNGQIMFEDVINLEVATRLAMETIQDNLGPTLRGLLGQGSAGEESSTSNSSG